MQPGAPDRKDGTNLIYRLPTILDRIELAELFTQAQPLEVELGSGDGSFLANYAQMHPEHNFIGVERLLGRIRKLDRKGTRLGLANVRGVRIESSYFLEYLLPAHAAVALHVYFPDPWPKKKHARHRLINQRFPAIAYQALAPTGAVYLRTDDLNYFEQMTEIFGNSPLFASIETPTELSAVVTDFEAGFQKQGIETLHAGYRLL